MSLLSKKWLLDLNEVLRSGNLSKIWKHSKVIAILKPGKDGTEPNHYRPISLLCIPYKLLERLILNRIESTIDTVVPREQAGLRVGRDCCEQVIALTSHIELGFQKKENRQRHLWICQRPMTLYGVMACCSSLQRLSHAKKMVKLLNSMLSCRYIRVSLGDHISRNRVLNNGLPQVKKKRHYQGCKPPDPFQDAYIQILNAMERLIQSHRQPRACYKNLG